MPRLAQARKARLSIPRVQRPKHPGVGRGHPAYRPRSGIAQRVVATKPPSAPTAQAQPSQAAVPATQSTPTAPLSETSPAQAPKPPTGLFDIPAWSGQGEDPRDATYWANLAKLRFSSEQDYAKTQLEQQRADTEYNSALQAAIRNRAQQQRGLGESAIRGNLGNSGWLDRSEAEDTTAYTQERSAAQLGKTEEDAAREAARKAIVQGYSLEAASELAEAAGRLAQRRQEEAEAAEGLAEEGGGSGGGGSVGSGYMQPGGYIKPWKPPKKSAPKQAIANRRRAR